METLRWIQIEKLRYSQNVQKLYSSETAGVGKIDALFNRVEMLKISQEHRELEAPIRMDEINKAISAMRCNSSPGPDGLTPEFYKKYKQLISQYLHELFTVLLDQGALPPSWLLTKVTLLQKQDSCIPESYHPISFLNVDYKILTSTLATRLTKILPNYIHKGQTGFVQGRQLRDNIRKLCNMIHYIWKQNLPTILMLCDAEKAFDCIQWELRKHVLAKMKFGVKFQKWIGLTYDKQELVLTSEGVTSNPLRMYRGVRQGCPLFPLIFDVIEMLSILVRQQKGIHGITRPCGIHKIYCMQTILLLHYKIQ